MAVRLLKPYNGQAIGTTYSGTGQGNLRALGIADDQVELASDYAQESRIVTDATASATGVNRVYVMNASSPQTLTIADMSAIPLQTVITVIQQGTGAFTIAAGTGVTINTALTSLVSKGQYNVAQLIMVARNSWIAFGGLGG